MDVRNLMKAEDHFVIGDFMNWVTENEIPKKKFIKYDNNFEELGYVLNLKFFYLYNEMMADMNNSPELVERYHNTVGREWKNIDKTRKVRLNLQRSGFFSIRLMDENVYIDMPMMGPLLSDYTIDGLALTLRYFGLHPFTKLVKYIYDYYGIGNGRLNGNTLEILKFLFNWNIQFWSSEGEVCFMSTLYKHTHCQAVRELFGIYQEE